MKQLVTIAFWLIATKLLGQTTTDTVYFNSKWKECPKDSASYYRIVDKNDPQALKGYVYDYYITGELQWKGKLNSDTSKLFDDTCIWYSKDKTILEIATYKWGELHGPYFGFYPNGTKKRHTTFYKSERIGRDTSWSITGDTVSVQDTCTYNETTIIRKSQSASGFVSEDPPKKDIEKIGTCYITRHPNGNLQHMYDECTSIQWDSNGKVLNHTEPGISIYYNRFQQVRKKELQEPGHLRYYTYDDSSRLIRFSETKTNKYGNTTHDTLCIYYSNGYLKESYSYTSRTGFIYFPSGKLKHTGPIFLNDFSHNMPQKTGKWQEFNEQNQLIRETTYNFGRIWGECKAYNESGQIIEKGFLKQSYKHRDSTIKQFHWHYFNSQGQLIKEEFYRHEMTWPYITKYRVNNNEYNWVLRAPRNENYSYDSTLVIYGNNKNGINAIVSVTDYTKQKNIISNGEGEYMGLYYNLAELDTTQTVETYSRKSYLTDFIPFFNFCTNSEQPYCMPIGYAKGSIKNGQRTGFWSEGRIKIDRNEKDNELGNTNGDIDTLERFSFSCMKGEYKNNQRNGIWKIYVDEIVFSGLFVNGKPEGKWTSEYRSNYRPMNKWVTDFNSKRHYLIEGYFKNGLPDSTWTMFYPYSKSIWQTTNFRSGELIEQKYFFKTGQLSSHTLYLQKENTFNYKIYTPYGKLFKQEVGHIEHYYSQPYSCTIAQTPTNKTYMKWTFRGELLEQGNYVNNKKHGPWLKYTEFNVYKEENFNMGVLHGHYLDSTYNTYFEKGRFVNGKKAGLWKIANGYDEKHIQYLENDSALLFLKPNSDYLYTQLTPAIIDGNGYKKGYFSDMGYTYTDSTIYVLGKPILKYQDLDEYKLIIEVHPKGIDSILQAINTYGEHLIKNGEGVLNLNHHDTYYEKIAYAGLFIGHYEYSKYCKTHSTTLIYDSLVEHHPQFLRDNISVSRIYTPILSKPGYFNVKVTIHSAKALLQKAILREFLPFGYSFVSCDTTATIVNETKNYISLSPKKNIPANTKVFTYKVYKHPSCDLNKNLIGLVEYEQGGKTKFRLFK